MLRYTSDETQDTSFFFFVWSGQEKRMEGSFLFLLLSYALTPALSQREREMSRSSRLVANVCCYRSGKIFYLLLSVLLDGRLISIIFRHVVAATRIDFKSPRFPFHVCCFHAHREFVHAAIVFFLFAEGKPETVSRAQIADHARQSSAVISNPTDVDSFAATLLRETL